MAIFSKKRTARGFRVYWSRRDRYGALVSIVESSSVEPQLWVQIDADERDRAGRADSQILFTVRAARSFAKALLEAADEKARAG